jgi:hypothetical protein
MRGLVTLLVVALTAAVLVAGCGGSGDGGNGEADDAQATAGDAQTISFQEPEDPGPDPFTEPADTEGDAEVELPADGPYGGSGSDKVCDRDKLIRYLKEHPDRMREWARVVGIKPTYKAVSKYIAKLHPVTLTRDTHVTNHSFAGRRAVPFQAILKAGTAVLVDEYGKPVARCRCGNPLAAPVEQKSARCVGCPANYKPPKQCSFYSREVDYDRRVYDEDYYDNAEYDKVFIRQASSGPYVECWEAYPAPPVVTIVKVYREPAGEEAVPELPVQPSEPPDTGLQCDPPRSQLEFERCRDQEQQHEPAPEEHPPETTPPETTPPEEPHEPRLPECDFRTDC